MMCPGLEKGHSPDKYGMISAHLDLFCHVDPISSVEICMLGNRMLIVIIVVPSQSIRIQTFIVFVLYVNTFFNASDFFLDYNHQESQNSTFVIKLSMIN